jgi:hypothetical protein
MIAALAEAHEQLAATLSELAPGQINTAMAVKKAVVLLHASMHDKCVLAERNVTPTRLK